MGGCDSERGAGCAGVAGCGCSAACGGISPGFIGRAASGKGVDAGAAVAGPCAPPFCASCCAAAGIGIVGRAARTMWTLAAACATPCAGFGAIGRTAATAGMVFATTGRARMAGAGRAPPCPPASAAGRCGFSDGAAASGAAAKACGATRTTFCRTGCACANALAGTAVTACRFT